MPGLGIEFLAEMRRRTSEVLDAPHRLPSYGGVDGVQYAHAVVRFPHLVVYLVVEDLRHSRAAMAAWRVGCIHQAAHRLTSKSTSFASCRRPYTGAKPHGRGTLATLVVMTGALRLLVEESEYELVPGDTIFFKADVQHVYENRSSHETRCFNVIRYQRES